MTITAPSHSRLPFPMPVGLQPKLMPDHVDDWIELLVLEDAPNSVLRFFRYLDRQGRMRTGNEMHRYCFGNLKRLATHPDPRLRVDVAESTLRAHAIPWLVAHGWLTVQKVIVKGREVSLWWCHWLLPVDPEACVFDLGLGFTTAPDARPLPRETRSRRTDFLSTESADHGAPQPAPTNPDGLEERNKKTTTDAGKSSSSFSRALEEPEKAEEIRQAPPAPPALDPGVARAIDREFPDPDDPGRKALLSKIPEWMQVHLIERIVDVIVELAGRRRKETIFSLPRYGDKILKDWEAKGEVSMRFGKPGAGPAKTGEEKRADLAADARAKDAARRAAAEEAERIRTKDAADKARWRAMPAADREPIVARVKHANPAMPERMLEIFFVQAMLEAGL